MHSLASWDISANFYLFSLFHKFSISFFPCRKYSNFSHAQDTVYQSKKKVQLFQIIKLKVNQLFINRFNPETDKLEPSVVQFGDKDLGAISRLIFKVFTTFRLIKVRKIEDKDNKGLNYEATNFTIINFALNILGPTHERTLTIILLIVQVIILNAVYLLNFLVIDFFSFFLRLCAVLLRSWFAIKSQSSFIIKFVHSL